MLAKVACWCMVHQSNCDMQQLNACMQLSGLVTHLLFNPLEPKRAFAHIEGKIHLGAPQEGGVYFVHFGFVGIIDQLGEQLLLTQ